MAGWSNNTLQYNLDENTKKLFLDKAKRRAELREEFLKLKFDPFRHASQEGGVLVCFSYRYVIHKRKKYFWFVSFSIPVFIGL